jgi:hypothetical protein
VERGWTLLPGRRCESNEMVPKIGFGYLLEHPYTVVQQGAIIIFLNYFFGLYVSSHLYSVSFKFTQRRCERITGCVDYRHDIADVAAAGAVTLILIILLCAMYYIPHHQEKPRRAIDSTRRPHQIGWNVEGRDAAPCYYIVHNIV